ESALESCSPLVLSVHPKRLTRYSLASGAFTSRSYIMDSILSSQCASLHCFARCNASENSLCTRAHSYTVSRVTRISRANCVIDLPCEPIISNAFSGIDLVYLVGAPTLAMPELYH